MLLQPNAIAILPSQTAMPIAPNCHSTSHPAFYQKVNSLIVLLGASGYVGSEFVRFFDQRAIAYKVLGRRDCDFYDPQLLSRDIAAANGDFLVNCAGYTGKPNVDACELHRTECLLANAVLPGRIAEACALANIPWGHVSSGCIFTGAKPDGSGFSEDDPPNFSFREGNCSFYSGSKALGEECLSDAEQCYVWRLRIPFNHHDSSRNYLSKVMRYDRLLDARNSLSHLREFVTACYDCWTRNVEFGTYNLTNSGSVTTREVVDLIRERGIVDKNFVFFDSEDDFMRRAAKTPRSNTVLDNSKALKAVLRLSPVREAIRQSLALWEVEGPSPCSQLRRWPIGRGLVPDGDDLR